MLRFANKPHNGGAKDGEFEMLLGISRTVVSVERVACRRVACSQSLAIARAVAGHPVRQRPTHRHHLAASRRRQRRLPGLLLLHCGGGTQDQIGRDAIGDVDFADIAPARASAAGDRRLAYQTVWAKSRRGGCPSQPHAGPSRSAGLLRTHLGDDFAGTAASPVGPDRTAAARDALCSQANDGHDSQGSRLAAVCHKAAIGGAAGGVDRSHAGKKRGKRCGSSSTAVIPSGPSCGVF